LRLWIKARARLPLLLHKLAKTGQDKFAVPFNLFVGECAERIEKYSSGFFVVRDPFLRFYFQHVYPHADLVEQKRLSRLGEIVRTNFNSYVGHTAYEELARRQIARLGDEQKLPFVPDYVGRAWTRHAELDVVAVGWKQRCVLIGECKWETERVTDAVLESLITRSENFPNFAGFKKSYTLFSKSGFSAPLQRRASSENILLFSGGKLELH
jgi:AAA+ ATPase superfamily predicted ATPase